MLIINKLINMIIKLALIYITIQAVMGIMYTLFCMIDNVIMSDETLRYYFVLAIVGGIMILSFMMPCCGPLLVN
jgi:hypothetical protein